MSKPIIQTVIIGLLAANLIIIAILLNTTNHKMQRMSTEISELRQELHHTRQHTVDQLSRQFESIVRDSQNKIENFTTTITEISATDQTAVMEIEFELLEVNEPDRVMVLYKTDQEADWTELEAARAGLLAYRAVFTASLKENYEFKIVEGRPSGASAQLNTSALRENLYQQYYEMRTYIDSSGRGESKEAITFDFSLRNNTFGLEEYSIQSVYATIFYEDTVLFEQDVTGLNRGNPDEIAYRNLQIASGQTVAEDPDISLKQDPDIQRMSFAIELNKDDLLNEFPGLLHLNSNGFLEKKDTDGGFQIEVRVVYRNGEEKQLAL